MNRRELLAAAGLASAAATLGAWEPLAQFAAPPGTGWRVFELTTRVEVLKPSGRTRAWLPTPLTAETPYQQALGNTFHAEGGAARFVAQPAFGVGLVAAEWPSGVAPVLTLASRVATRDYTVDLTGPPRRAPVDWRALARFLRPTSLLPTDGIVRLTAQQITRGAKTDVDKARAIYEWIVENTFRDAETRGCGIGDIRFMLETKNLGGKCADLNPLFVGLARAAGLPARDVYGIRVARSDRGFKSLGAASGNVTRSQHCRAEVHLDGYGWAPVDPADVRKVVLEEPPGHLAMTDEPVRRARAALFGGWEMNWVGYNFANDVVLPGAAGKPLGFLMYPQAETANGRLDSLDPDVFTYQITSREIA